MSTPDPERRDAEQDAQQTHPGQTDQPDQGQADQGQADQGRRPLSTDMIVVLAVVGVLVLALLVGGVF